MIEGLYSLKITIHLVGEDDKVFVDSPSLDFVGISDAFSNCFEIEYPLIVDDMFCLYEFKDSFETYISDEPIRITSNEEIGYAMVWLQKIC